MEEWDDETWGNFRRVFYLTTSQRDFTWGEVSCFGIIIITSYYNFGDNSSTFTVSVANSGFTASLANAELNAIYHTMLCYYTNYSSGIHTYSSVDASNDIVLSNGKITRNYMNKW